MNLPGEFSVSVLEGATSDDVATYFCREKPTLVSLPVEDGVEEIDSSRVFVKFIPRNGSPFRVNRVTLVPIDRIVALVLTENAA